MSVAEPDAPRPTSEGLFGYRRDHGVLRAIATRELADEFYAELRHYMQQAAERPESFPIRDRDLRRVNLQRFPYHFLFRTVGGVVRILVVRHHSRRPALGIRRR